MVEPVIFDEIECSVDTKQPLYQRKIDEFGKHWDELGRKIIISEKMLYFHKHFTDTRVVRNQYYLQTAQLLCDLEHTDDVLVNKEHAETFEECKKVFEELKPDLLKKSEYREKYVAIVHGEIHGINSSKIDLVKEMSVNFGNIEMYIGKISTRLERGIIDTPEQR